MPTYHIWTMGCQMNRADSQHLAACLEGAGYSPVDGVEAADIIILNTCVVRQGAEDRALNRIAALRPLKQRRPGVTLLVTGCLASSADGALKKRFPFVDAFLPPQGLPGFLEETARLGLDCLCQGQAPAPSSGVSAFVPIIRGCDNFCTYCIVPHRRGREKSRPLDKIVCDVERLAQQGTKEVTLLGQNVDSYGHDLPERPDLAGLLAELEHTPGLERLRFLTNHPKDMSRRLMEAIARLDKVCEHVNLPVQAGDDEVLRAMRRGYTVDAYRRLVEDLRATVPGIALSTDMIVGFPGESPEQFARSMALLEEIRFDVVHLAAYSPRPGTAAAKLEDSVSPAEKAERLHQAEELQARIAAAINEPLQGTVVEVLVEGRKKGKWQGRTRTDKLVFFADREDCLGRLVQVRVEKASAWALQGSRAARD